MERPWWSWAAIGGAGGGLLSLLLPWDVVFFFGRVSVNGLETGDGKAAGVGLVIAAALLWPAAMGQAVEPMRALGAALGGVALAALAGFHALGFSAGAEIADVHEPGIGAWLGLMAGSALAASAWAARQRETTPTSF